MCELTVPWEGTRAGSKQVEEGAAEAQDWTGWAAPSRSPQFPSPSPVGREAGAVSARPGPAYRWLSEADGAGPGARALPPLPPPTPPDPGSFAVMNDFPQPLSWELRG